MGCTVRTNRHGYLAFRLYFDGLESHEGTKLRDTPQNREKVRARARLIAQEIRDGSFNYLRWFPAGNLASRFEPASMPVASGRSTTVRSFFREWTSADSSARLVSPKWQLNRESYIRNHVLPSLGRTRLDELAPSHVTELQTSLRRKRLAPSTIDRVIHSALRGMLRDADLAGHRVTDLATLFDPRLVGHLDRGRHAAEIDPFTEEERDQILAWFVEERPQFHAFVFFRFWTGTRPSEAIGLRWRDIDLPSRRVRIRRSRVYGADGQTKTGRSKRDVLLPGKLERLLRAHRPRRPAPDDFVFTTPSGAPITAVNFYRREWLPALESLGIRARPFYNTRHTYITTLLEAGAKPLFICRQAGTSLAMIEKHYGAVRTDAKELDRLLDQPDDGPSARPTRNPPGTLSSAESRAPPRRRKKRSVKRRLRRRKRSRDDPPDIQPGKLDVRKARWNTGSSQPEEPDPSQRATRRPSRRAARASRSSKQPKSGDSPASLISRLALKCTASYPRRSRASARPPARRTSASVNSIATKLSHSSSRFPATLRSWAGESPLSRRRRAKAARASAYAMRAVATASASCTHLRTRSLPSSSMYSFTRALVSR